MNEKITRRLDKKISAIETEIQLLMDGIDKTSIKSQKIEKMQIRLSCCSSNLFYYPNNKEPGVECSSENLNSVGN